jgi:fido (protein-threonine AMPylation protein)
LPANASTRRCRTSRPPRTWRITLHRVDELEAGDVRIDGSFDFDHHRAIHRHIFGDVYEWAGDPRTVDMSKTHRLWPAINIVDAAPSVYGAID